MTTTTTTASTGPLTASGAAPLPFTFQALSATEIEVTRAGVVAAANTYTVALNGDGTGTVTPLATWGADEVYIYSAPNYQQTADFGRFVQFFPDAVNGPFDRQARATLALREQMLRSISSLSLSVASQIAAIPSVQGPPGINGAVGSSAGFAAKFTTAAGMAVGVGITGIITAEHTSNGLGGALYLYDATVNAAYVIANPLIAFLAADGRGFKLDDAQGLTIEMAGGRGNWVSWASVGVDNTPALNALLNGFKVVYDTLSAKGPTINFAAKNYYFSAEVAPRMQVNLIGQGSGHDDRTNMTRFMFPTDTHGIVINSAGTDSSGDITPNQLQSGGSNIVGICAVSQNATIGANIRHGFILHARANLIYCISDGFTGNGFHVVAGSTGLTQNGNSNGWMMFRCYNKLCGRHALYIKGNDVNAGNTYSFQNKGSGLCGIFESSGLGNQHYNFWNAGHNQKALGAVTYGGRQYVLIDAVPGIGQSTTPGTNDTVWCDVGSGGSYPAWDALVAYEVALAVFADGTSNRSGFHGGYQEGHYSHCETPQSVRDWQGVWTRYSPLQGGVTTAGDALYSNTGYGGYYKPPPGSTLGTYARATIGGDFVTGTFLAMEQEIDPGPWRWRFVGANLLLDLGAVTTTQVFEVTGPLTVQTFGSAAVKPYVFNAYQFALGKSVRRIIDNGTAVPTTGESARGDIRFNTSASAAGIPGWVCTTSGTNGSTSVWKAMAVLAA